MPIVESGEPAIAIRPATSEDVGALTRLYLDSAEHHAGLDGDYYAVPDSSAVAAAVQSELASAHDTTRAVLVADIDGEVLGSVEVEIRVAPPSSMIRPVPTAWIGVVVDQKRRGEGIGRRLLEAAERWARDRGAGAMMLDMSAANEPARAFYEDVGYTIGGFLLRKPLGPPHL
jgi:GNAT superfamily N-acetyltransferase